MWVPQGLVKYECNNCSRQFLVGMVDGAGEKPRNCPFCSDGAIEYTCCAEPNQDYSPWLDEMGCMGIHYDPEKVGD